MLNMTAVGRIGRDVELRHTPNGDAVCNVVIGCNYGQRGNDNRQPTQWVEGAIWGKRAEALAEYLTKGKQVILVLSDVHIETYQGQNGDGHKLVGKVQELAFGAEPRGDQGQGQGGGAPQRQQQRAPARGQQQRAPARNTGGGSSGFDDMDQDIPF